jgi:hypothetical protein
VVSEHISKPIPISDEAPPCHSGRKRTYAMAAELHRSFAAKNAAQNAAQDDKLDLRSQWSRNHTGRLSPHNLRIV